MSLPYGTQMSAPLSSRQCSSTCSLCPLLNLSELSSKCLQDALIEDADVMPEKPRKRLKLLIKVYTLGQNSTLIQDTVNFSRQFSSASCTPVACHSYTSPLSCNWSSPILLTNSSVNIAPRNSITFVCSPQSHPTSKEL